ncbi:MAG: hypothetical protein ACK4UU_06500, partial [Fimbriimonadales bacterium]
PNPTDDSDLEDWLEARLAIPPMDLKEHVRAQLRLTVAPKLWHIAEHLVESLDEKGFLRVEVEDVALYFNVAPETVEELITRLQQCDPPGVGARTLQESLLLQLDALPKAPDQYPPEILDWTHAVLQHGWDDLVSGRWQKLARKLRLSPDALMQVKQFIRSELTHNPAGEFATNEPIQEQQTAQEPDIIVRLSQNGLHIEIRGGAFDSLRLSPAYLEQASRLNQGSLRCSADEREHIRHYLGRARIFLQALQQRYQTLKRIVDVIAQRQYGFLVTSDARFLQPMTRLEVAQATGLHRSTIGRAVRNKWMQLPSGKMAPLDIFFDASYRTAILIEQILEQYESGGRRLSDAEIAEKLAEMGINVARRTVAKYRQRHNILSSHWRERRRLVG